VICNGFDPVKALVEAGYTLIPLKGKVPFQKNWPNAPFNPNLTKDSFPDNYGVVLQADDLIVDIDPRNFKNGNNSLDKLLTDINWTVNSFIVKTGGGGYHIYLKKDPKINIVTGVKKYPGVEFKTKGAQIVGPGSIHPDSKKLYIIYNSRPISTLLAPSELINMIKTNIESDRMSVIVDEKLNLDINLSGKESDRYIKYLLDQAPRAVAGENGNNITFQVACKARDYGLTKALAFSLLLEHYNPLCEPPWSTHELRTLVKNAYNYAQSEAGGLSAEQDFDKVMIKRQFKELAWTFSRNGALTKCLANTVNYFFRDDVALCDCLTYNEFSNEIEFMRPAPWHNKVTPTASQWKDTDTVSCKFYLSYYHKFDISTNYIEEAAYIAARQRAYHPIRDYIKGLQWDGQERLEEWLIKSGGAEDNVYIRDVSKKVLVAAVARAMRPGVKFDHVLVLEGAQRIGKSTLVDILGGEWYTDIALDPHNNDTVNAMGGKWIIEISEMECTRRTEVNALKAFLSRRSDRMRVPYGKHAEDFPRQCIFIGTINPEPGGGYLKDATGNTRFWPVEVGKIDFEYIHTYRDQLFAEAMKMYKKGVPLYLTNPTSINLAIAAQTKRQPEDMWENTISEYLSKILEKEGRSFVTVNEIWERALFGSAKDVKRLDIVRISKIMVIYLGWAKGISRSPTGVKRGFIKKIKGLDI